MAGAPPSTRREVMAAFLPASPLNAHLDIRLVELGDDRVELALPFDERLTTLGDVVHGGAIASLVDVAGMAAAWADDEPPGSGGGSTVNLHVDYLAPASGVDLTAIGTVLRRGRTLCFCEVSVSGADGRLVARGSMVHRYG